MKSITITNKNKYTNVRTIDGDDIVKHASIESAFHFAMINPTVSEIRCSKFNKPKVYIRTDTNAWKEESLL